MKSKKSLLKMENSNLIPIKIMLKRKLASKEKT